MSEIKKNPDVVEIKDDELDAVAGGAYTQEEWRNMTTEERKAAQTRSLLIMSGKVPGVKPEDCEML